jgi:hypothetical protein
MSNLQVVQAKSHLNNLYEHGTRTRRVVTSYQEKLRLCDAELSRRSAILDDSLKTMSNDQLLNELHETRKILATRNINEINDIDIWLSKYSMEWTIRYNRTTYIIRNNPNQESGETLAKLALNQQNEYVKYQRDLRDHLIHTGTNKQESVNNEPNKIEKEIRQKRIKQDSEDIDINKVPFQSETRRKQIKLESENNKIVPHRETRQTRIKQESDSDNATHTRKIQIKQENANNDSKPDSATHTRKIQIKQESVDIDFEDLDV